MTTLKERKDLLDCFVESVTGDEPSAQVAGKSLFDKDASEMLLSDLETKLCEIIQEAKKTMRHSKRTILTTSDIDSAFRKLNIKVSNSAWLSVTCIWVTGDLRVPFFGAVLVLQSSKQ